jgi:hypothetical protein
MIGVLKRRIVAAKHRRDSARAAKLASMLKELRRGGRPGQTLLDLQAIHKPIRNATAVVRLPGRKPFTPKPKQLRGGL